MRALSGRRGDERAGDRGADPAREARAAPSRECGSATPVVVAVLAIIVIVGLAAVDGGSVMVADAKVEAAADLAVLAAARVDRDSRAEGASSEFALQCGCEAAREVASLNGVAMTSCQRGPRLSISIMVDMRVRAWPRPLRASARAGPAWG